MPRADDRAFVCRPRGAPAEVAGVDRARASVAGPGPAPARRGGAYGARRRAASVDARSRRGRALSGRRPASGAPACPINAYGHDQVAGPRCARASRCSADDLRHDHFASNDGVGTRLMLAQYFTCAAARSVFRTLQGDSRSRCSSSRASPTGRRPNGTSAGELPVHHAGRTTATPSATCAAARAHRVHLRLGDQAFGYDPERHDDGVKRIMGRWALQTARRGGPRRGPPGHTSSSAIATSARPCRPSSAGAHYRRADTDVPRRGRSSPTSSLRAWRTPTRSSRRSSTWPGCHATRGRVDDEG
jgi:hypothetical protein